MASIIMKYQHLHQCWLYLIKKKDIYFAIHYTTMLILWPNLNKNRAQKCLNTASTGVISCKYTCLLLVIFVIAKNVTLQDWAVLYAYNSG